jgi:hypothetical protein
VSEKLLPNEGGCSPYLIEGPAIIAFSGGESSGYMLCKIVEAHGGKLPDGVHVVTCNTGKERPEWLRFARQVGEHLSVYINLLEWRLDEPGFEHVSFNSADMEGRTFAALIGHKGYLPNREAGYCSIELKTRVSWAFARKELGWKNWKSVVGFRADEQPRVGGSIVRNLLKKDCWQTVCPMASANVAKSDVAAFWEAMPFRLGTQNHQNNCTLCWKKTDWKLDRNIRDEPGIEAWWVEQEERLLPKQEGLQRFKLDETMRARADRVARSPMFDLPTPDDLFDESCEGDCPAEIELRDHEFQRSASQ